MAARYWLSALVACGAISVSLAQSAEAAPQGFKDYSEDAFEAFAEQVSSGEVLIAGKPNCNLPDGKPGDINKNGDCVPKGCEESGYTPPKCHAYDPDKNVDGDDGIGDGNSAIPSIDKQKDNYTSQELQKGEVEPRFEGGTLSFESKPTSLEDDFEVSNLNGIINSEWKYVELKGEFVGSGGLTFKGSPRGSESEDKKEIQLSGNVDYTGETVVATSGGVALAIQDKQATPKGDITIQDAGILRLRGDGIEVVGDLVIEDGGTLGIFGKDVILKGDVELSDDLNKQLGSSFYVDLSHARAEDQL